VTGVQPGRRRWGRRGPSGLVVGLLALAQVPIARAADEPRLYVVDPSRSRIGFHATSRFMDADGTFERFTGELRVDPANPVSGIGRVTVWLESLDTGIRLRDNHLRSDDFLDVARHPTATFVSSSASHEGTAGRLSGELTIRGVTRVVTLSFSLKPAGKTLRIAGAFSIRREDFGVTYRSFLNPIGDEVRVSFDLTAVPG